MRKLTLQSTVLLLLAICGSSVSFGQNTGLAKYSGPLDALNPRVRPAAQPVQPQRATRYAPSKHVRQLHPSVTTSVVNPSKRPSYRLPNVAPSNGRPSRVSLAQATAPPNPHRSILGRAVAVRPAAPTFAAPVDQYQGRPIESAYDHRQLEPAYRNQQDSFYQSQSEPVHDYQSQSNYSSQAEPAYDYQTESAYGGQPESANGYQSQSAYGGQAESAFDYQPQPRSVYDGGQPESAYDYQPRSAFGFQSEDVTRFGYRDGEAFGFTNRLYHPLEGPQGNLQGTPTIDFGTETCDEWDGFCECVNLEYDCPCGGLKAKPGHLGIPWLRSKESCDQTEPLLKNRGCGCIKCRLREGRTPGCSDGSCGS